MFLRATVYNLQRVDRFRLRFTVVLPILAFGRSVVPRAAVYHFCGQTMARLKHFFRRLVPLKAVS